jgi:hypothetical protein
MKKFVIFVTVSGYIQSLRLILTLGLSLSRPLVQTDYPVLAPSLPSPYTIYPIDKLSRPRNGIPIEINGTKQCRGLIISKRSRHTNPEHGATPTDSPKSARQQTHKILQ